MTCVNTKKRFWVYNVIFALVCIVGYSSFWIRGKSLVWEIDGLGQYYPSFLYIGQYLREGFYNFFHGNFGLPLFDISIGMGDDIIGTLNYYGFGDPLNILALFATKDNGAYIFTGMYFLRLYLSGLCFRKYCIYFGLDEILTNAGALCYTFSGYALIGGARYMQFLSPAIYFPLILLGCEKILHEKKILLFTLSVAYAALCNFYFLYMTSLFLVFYYIVRYISVYGIKKFPGIFKEIMICIESYLLGVMLAAPILFPSICSFLNSARNTSDPKGSLLYVGNYLLNKDKFIQYIVGGGVGYTDNYWTGIPLVQCACLIGTVFLYKSKRNRQCALAVILGTIFWCMPITSIVLSGFGKVYTRWVFILYFVYAVVFICFAEETFKNEKGKRIILLAVTLNICVNLIKLYGISGENWNDEFVAFSDVYRYTDSPVNEAKEISGDDDIYRIANDTYTDINGRPENTAMINGYNGLNFWFSIINGNVQRMIDQIGTSKKTEWRSYGLNNITIYETLAGVKYYIERENSVKKAGYECVEEVTFGDECWKVYKNENALPLISVYNECITEDFFNQLNELEKVEAAARYIALDNGCINPVRSIEPGLIYELDTVKERNGKNMSVECYAGDGEIYLEIGLSDLQNKFSGFTLNNNENLLYKGSGNKRTIYNLGAGFAGEKLSFSMELGELEAEEADRILEQTKVYVMDSDKYEKTIWERNELGESDICISNNKIKIEDIHLNEAKWMVLALPYSSNWKCYVDDKETNIYKGNTMYMVVRLEEGEHEIMFEYRGISFYIGIISGLISLCIMLVKTKIMSA